MPVCDLNIAMLVHSDVFCERSVGRLSGEKEAHRASCLDG